MPCGKTTSCMAIDSKSRSSHHVLEIDPQKVCLVHEAKCLTNEAKSMGSVSMSVYRCSYLKWQSLQTTQGTPNWKQRQLHRGPQFSDSYTLSRGSKVAATTQGTPKPKQQQFRVQMLLLEVSNSQGLKVNLQKGSNFQNDWLNCLLSPSEAWHASQHMPCLLYPFVGPLLSIHHWSNPKVMKVHEVRCCGWGWIARQANLRPKTRSV